MSSETYVSIGMPVYNGENFLEEALDSLLAQTYTHFELIISDNGSTDKTEEILRAYAARDSRIRYHRSDINHGAAWNFNRLVELAQGEFFMWASHDDLWASDFIESSVLVLEQHPDSILCYSTTNVINGKGKAFREISIKPELTSDKPYKRFAAVLRYPPQVPVFGLIRTAALRNTRLIGNFSSADRILAAELSLLGCFQGIDRPLFFYRRHVEQSTGSQNQTQQNLEAWYDPTKREKRTFRNWKLVREFFLGIFRAPINISNRILCLLLLLRWMLRRSNIEGLVMELIIKNPKRRSSRKRGGEKISTNEISKRSLP